MTHIKLVLGSTTDLGVGHTSKAHYLFLGPHFRVIWRIIFKPRLLSPHLCSSPYSFSRDQPLPDSFLEFRDLEGTLVICETQFNIPTQWLPFNRFMEYCRPFFWDVIYIECAKHFHGRLYRIHLESDLFSFVISSELLFIFRVLLQIFIL